MFKLTGRMNVIKIIAKNEIESIYYNYWFYLILFFSFLIASFLINSTINTVIDNKVMVLNKSLNTPMFFVVIIGTFYLAISSLISISNEKEKGTLKVLFCGPVDSVSYISGKYIGKMLVYLGMVIFYIVYFYTISLLTNLRFSFNFLQILFLSFFYVSCMVSFGIILASITESYRNSILLFIGFNFFFLALYIFYIIIMAFPIEELSTFFRYIRSGLYYLNNIIEWISPFSYFQRSISAANLNIGKFIVTILYSLLYSSLLLGCSIKIFSRREIRK
jgi:ABC-type transport system involved in multi-copper enzyme maturation permease subunit